MGLSFYCHFSLALMLVALFLRYALLNCQCLFFSKWMCHKKEKLNNAGSDHAKRQECVISLLTQIYIYIYYIMPFQGRQRMKGQ